MGPCAQELGLPGRTVTSSSDAHRVLQSLGMDKGGPNSGMKYDLEKRLVTGAQYKPGARRVS